MYFVSVYVVVVAGLTVLAADNADADHSSLHDLHEAVPILSHVHFAYYYTAHSPCRSSNHSWKHLTN